MKMVEYRRRFSGGPPERRPPREEREEREEGEERPYRRYSTPWRRRHRATEEGEETGRILEPWELFPGIEKGEFFEPGAVFERAFEMPRPQLPLFPGAGPAPERGVPPPPGRPGPGRPGARRPTRAPGEPPLVDPGRFFDLAQVFATVRQWRKDPRFPKGQSVSVLNITNPLPDEESRAEALAQIFGIPPEEFDRYSGMSVWTELIHPLLDELSYAINRAKPADLPGEFGFQEARDGSMRLGYMER